MKRNHLIILLFICLVPVFSFGQSEIIDASFGDKGKTIVPVSTGNDFIWAMAIYPDGKILTAGASYNGTDYDFAFVRLNSNGSIDNTFGVNGIKTLSLGTSNDRIASIAIRSDGKIVAGGYYESGSTWAYVLLRLNSDGSLDTSFGENGYVTKAIGESYFYCIGLVLQSDNKIVAAGSAWNGNDWDFAAARFLENGTLDNTFSDDGISSKNLPGSNDYGHSVALLSDGRIVVVGELALSNYNSMMVMRLDSDGSLDNGLIPNGASTLTFTQGNSTAQSVVFSSDNSMWLTGSVYNGTNWDIAIGRMTSAGQFDGIFGPNGTLIVPVGKEDDFSYSILMQPDGKVIIGGYTVGDNDDDFVLIRLNADGSFDKTFNQTGIFQYSVSTLGDACYSMAFQSDGKLLTAGESKSITDDWNFTIVRFLTDLKVGVIDMLSSSQLLVYPNPIHVNSVLEYSLAKAECLSISIYNSEGKKLICMMDKNNLAAGKYTQPLNDLVRLPGGNYLIVFDNGISKHSIKVIK